ncbi:hypothetical protein JL09_g6104 [Pichia kudriavzevii]|uniref:Uncharacterized protein n=1 Tax=Pichia kudriavzevii TaxID=4909 RepID=A0A099NS34_PICKU|nr:hypothetical protein JL09_g6104 [Pichia kudriavzevii]
MPIRKILNFLREQSEAFPKRFGNNDKTQTSAPTKGDAPKVTEQQPMAEPSS